MWVIQIYGGGGRLDCVCVTFNVSCVSFKVYCVSFKWSVCVCMCVVHSRCVWVVGGCLGGDVRVCAEELLTVPKERAPAEREFPRRVMRVGFWSRSARLVRGLVREWWLLPAGIIGQVGLLQVVESPGSVRETVTVGVIALHECMVLLAFAKGWAVSVYVVLPVIVVSVAVMRPGYLHCY